MSWKTFHHRGEVLRAVVDDANRRCDGALPTEVPGVAEQFADELDLVGALRLKWHARLSGNIERAWASEPMDLESAVASAWRATAEQMRGVRLVLDRCAEQPSTPEMDRAMMRATALERGRLATAAGLASGHSAEAVAVGHRIEVRAREELAPVRTHGTARARSENSSETRPSASRPAAEELPRSEPSFADRLRAALAA